MDSTTLRLMTVDGQLTATFEAQLTTAQYAELLDIVERFRYSTDLTAALKSLGQSWGVGVIVDLI